MALQFPLEYFALNHAFAARAAEITGCSLADAYLRYTQLYLAFGLERSFDPCAPAWEAFVQGIGRSGDPVQWIDTTFHRLRDGETPRERENAFGCFSYAIWEGGRIRLHFYSGDPGYSPLASANFPARVEELRGMFHYLHQNVQGARTVVGGSWLYNIEAYRRLFPPEFLQTAAPEETEPQFIALWGQFLSHNRQVKADLAWRFLDAVSRAQTQEDLMHAFPYPVLRLECPVEVFHQYFEDKEED